MPLKGILDLDGSKRTWDEYLGTEKDGDFPYGVKYALYKNASSERDRWVSVTSILYCLRKSKFEHDYDYFLTQKNAYYFMRGSLIHGILAANSREGALIEKTFSRPVPGTNLNLVGQIDIYENSIITDYKTMVDQGIYSVRKNGLKEEHVMQVNMYKWMLNYHKIDVKELRIAYVMMGDCVQSGRKFYIEDRKRPGEFEEAMIPTCPIYPSDRVEGFVVSRFKALEASVEPPANPKEWMCRGCYFKDSCHAVTGKGNAEVSKSMGDLF